MDTITVARQLQSMKTELASRFVGRDDVIDIVMLALISKHHAVFLGPPGTTKSNIIEQACQLLDVPYFSYLMSKFTRPEEITGAVDLRAMKEENVIRYNTCGMLPEARIAFLDEIFKASSAIQNFLLRVTNERTFVNGGKVMQLPLWSLFSASNETPAEGEGLDAFYDRFLYRSFVNYIPDSILRELLVLYMHKQPATIGTVFNFTMIEQAHVLIPSITIDDRLINELIDLFKRCASVDVQVSDRRKARCTIALRASAIVNGRDHVMLADFSVLKNVIPGAVQEVVKIETILNELIGRNDVLVTDLRNIIAQVTSKASTVEHMTDISSILNEVSEITTLKRNISSKMQKIDDVTIATDLDDAISKLEAVLAKKIMEATAKQ